jgi:pimeloyl-ACP methyl ester carboxylesterase
MDAAPAPGNSNGPADAHFDAGGIRLHYVDWGNAEARPMVLLHGLQDCARSWDFFARSMAPDFHIVALDHRGHGDSEWVSQDRYRLRDYVADVEALMDHLGLDDVVLVGHSAGGRNAWMYTVGHPDRVSSLVIVDIEPDAENPESSGMFERYHAEPDEWESPEAIVERLRGRQPESTEEMLRHQAAHMTNSLSEGVRVWKRDRKLLEAYERPDLWDEWSRIMCPTLIVRGRQSELLTHAVAIKMREAIRSVRLVELDGGGHWFYQEFPGAFETTVRWFLQRPPG